ncbi:cytidine deaminase [Psychromarinibacter sp. C21-152]|uniref:Cytidine deaminase n=1 Tax=Psychromarinibacter sediminicola TaxID=3033385 RepID=A0AAE3NV41_9RHOB|nr:cytidine deaminase [Psychromarinibacter sediminicola]MDF0602841.1 cytidine deaminase [Psychromarinibacter sediminicola]
MRSARRHSRLARAKTKASGKSERDMALIDEAAAVRDNAYAPYSAFRVGAAVRAGSGAVFTGVNVENAAYPEGTCAEAGAIAAMVAAGETAIAEVAVIADCPDPVAPCGGCRQKIAEFAGPDVVVTMGTVAGARAQLTVRDMLPGAFAKSSMDKA